MKKLKLRTAALAAGLFAATLTVNAQWGEDVPNPYSIHEEFGASKPCTTYAVPWYEGGNNVTNGLYSSNIIGTCNDKDFILQAASKKSVFITTQGNIGIGAGNSAPSTVLDISGDQGTNHLKIYGDNAGTIEATHNINLLFDDQSQFAIAARDQNGSPTFLIGANMAGIDLIHHTNVSGNLSVSNKFNVASSTGKTNVGYQPNAGNSSQLNVNVNGGNAIEVFDQASNKVNFRVKANGGTQIGPGTPLSTGVAANAQLSVDGLILAKEIRVSVSNTHWADYVFDKNYKLTPLPEVDKFIKANKHLPEVPSEAEVKENGIDLSEMNVLLLKKVEEITLHLIDLNKKVEGLVKENEELKAKITNQK